MSLIGMAEQNKMKVKFMDFRAQCVGDIVPSTPSSFGLIGFRRAGKGAGRADKDHMNASRVQGLAFYVGFKGCCKGSGFRV